MSTDIVLEGAERRIERVRATYYVSRMLAQSGVLHLTNIRFIFVPTGAIDRVIGAERITLLLEDIQRFTCEGDSTKKLMLRSAIKTYRFVGRSFENLERELRRLLERAPSTEVVASREEVLCEARVNLFVSRLITQSGTLHLTNRRLSFTPVGVLDRAMGARDVQLPLETIEALETSGQLDRRTRIRARNHHLLLLGQIPEEFVSTLRRLLAARGILLAMSEVARSPQSAPAPVRCSTCARLVDPLVGFCPHCGTTVLA